MKYRIKKIIKNFIKILKKPFMKISYINNIIYKNDLLCGRTALITGGTSCIGYAIAKLFVINGANIIITGRKQEKLDNAIDNLTKLIPENRKNFVKGYKMDNSEINDIKSNFNTIIELSDNSLDILVNNAGIMSGDAIGNTNEMDYEKCLKINLEGMYFLSQEFFNYMKKQKRQGNILNVLSSSSLRPAINPYSISKWGAKGLTIGMAKKFIEYGIVVNGIAPGPTYTEMLVENINDENLYLDNSPAKRYILPEEIANAAVFLVSDMGKMVIGDIMYMTGGSGTITVDDIEYNY